MVKNFPKIDPGVGMDLIKIFQISFFDAGWPDSILVVKIFKHMFQTLKNPERFETLEVKVPTQWIDEFPSNFLNSYWVRFRN